MRRSASLCIALAVGLAACTSDAADPGGGDGLRVTGVQPAAGAAGVPWTATFTATMSAPLDPASVGGATVALTRDGAPVPAVVTYEGSSRTIQVAAPLLPGSTYRAELTPGIRGLDGDSLSDGLVWTATTRAWAPTLLLPGPGELEERYDVALGPSGSVHLAGYGELRPTSDYFTRYTKYAACSSSCDDPARWGRMAVDSAYLPSGYAAVEVARTGAIHLMHVGVSPVFPRPDELRYGTCTSDCLTPANWTMATLATSDGSDPTYMMAGFALDAGGTLHLVTHAWGSDPAVHYATCQTDCTDPAAWTSAPIPVSGYAQDPSQGLTIDGTGRLHLLTAYAGVVTYSTCPSDCLSPAQWSSTPPTWPGPLYVYPSLAVDGAGRVHLVYSAVDGDFTYARCDAECALPASWSTVRLDDGDGGFSALAVDGDGRITALHPFGPAGELRFLTCLADCLEPEQWQLGVADRQDISGVSLAGPPRLELGSAGRLSVTYSDVAAALRYLE
jgi:hypothetical protein